MFTTSPGPCITCSWTSSVLSTSTWIGTSSTRLSVRVADTVTCSSTDAPRVNSMSTGCCWLAWRSTEADAGANPSLMTTMSVWPGGPVDNDLGVSHRAHGASDLNMNCRRLGRRSDRVERQQHTRDESTHANLHSQPAQQRFSPCASAQTTTVTV